MKTWFITGCSSGLGSGMAKYFVEQGDQVVATARKVESLEQFANEKNALILPLDVTKIETIDQAISKALEKFGKIDVLINNAGFGFRGAVEEANDSEIDRIWQTNFFGAVHMIQKVLPSMRENRSGTIVNITSIAAFETAAGSGYYGATKAALESISDALRKETAPLGIRVMIVEPGPFKTDFAGRSLVISEKNISDYDETSGKRKFRNDPHTEWRLGDPDLAAKVISEVLNQKEIPARLLLGSDAVEIGERYCENRLNEIRQWKSFSVQTDSK